VPVEYLKKITSTRIFGTLFYPNTLAGFLLLILPVLLTVTWRAETRFTRGARIFLVACIAAGGLACLFWSGSKGGWLLMLLLGGLGVLRLNFARQAKIAIVCAALVLGLAGFFYKYAGFFRKGATSVVARFDYWEAAGKTALKNPWTGTGPGTFSVSYRAIKRPESEMARLAHNDYVQQASDCGFPAAVLYLAFVGIGLRRSWLIARLNPIDFALWLGVLGWALQSFIEFNLYIPALAWTSFIFLGWLWGRQDALRVSKQSV
jgi:O-antigen ligase